MAKQRQVEEQDPTVRLRTALEFLREEAGRLEMSAVASAISRVLAILCSQKQMKKKSVPNSSQVARPE